MRSRLSAHVLWLLPLLGLGVRVGSSSLAPRLAHAAPAEATAVRTVYDLQRNRVHASVYAGGRLTLTPGSTDFLKYVDGGWKTSWILGQTVDGRAAALVSGLSSLFFVPVDADGDGVGVGEGTLSLSMRAMAPGQKVSIFVNEKPAGTIDVPAEWKEHVVPLKAGLLEKGENRVRLTFKSAGNAPGGKRAAAALDRIGVGPAGAAPFAGALPLAPQAVTLAGTAKKALTLPGPSRVSYYVQVPPQGSLVVSVGSQSPGTTALVRVSADGVAPKVLHQGAAEARWQEVTADLSAYGDRAVRIDLVSRGGGVAWADARIVAKTTAAAKAPSPAPHFDRVFVWMVDTLRADKLRVYNPKSIVETPTFDAFAADATRFAWHHVPGTWSLPSHSSILTGVFPSVHKAIAHEAKLARDVPFVAEELKKAGYKTALFSSNGYISSKWGFDRGWDESRNFIRENLPNGADYIWKTAKPWVTGNAAKKQFVYFATVEPHVIYNPKKEFLAKYWKKPYTGPIKPALTGIQLGSIKAGKLKVNDTDKAYLEALHNAEITQADAAFAEFLADLKKAGLYETSAIIVVSDHGDEFWDHGDVGHAQSVHQELVHVPLIIRAPGLFPIGKVVKTDVEAMDLAPTLLDLAGVAAPEKMQGASLLNLAWDEVAAGPGTGLSQNVAISRGLKSGRYRLINAGPGRLELYDQFKDPTEKTDVAGEQPIALRQLRQVMGLLVGFENKWKKRTWGTAANVSEAFYGAATF